MSSDDENRNRTVFRPSPLQGLRNKEPGGTQFGQPPQPGGQPPYPAAPQQYPPQQQYPQQPPPQPFPAQPPQPFPAAQPPYPAAQPPYAAPPQPEQGPPPQVYAQGPAEQLPDDDVPKPSLAQKVRNVMMDQAAPVLALAASVRAGRVQITLPQLHGQAIATIGKFEQAIRASDYPEEQRQRAKYAICATMDDIAQNLPGQAADGAEWARRSMTVQFFSENIGGDRFWQLVDDMLSRPASNGDLIELYHACLAAGFEGRFRVMADGRRRLDDVMSRLYAALEHVRSLSQLEVSPHWKGHPKAMSRVGFWAPLILAAGGALAALFLIYVVLRLILMQTGSPAQAQLASINPSDPLRLTRPAVQVQQTMSAQGQALQAFLAPQIAAHEVVVIEDGTTDRVRTTIGTLFKSGSDQLNPPAAGQQDPTALFQTIGDAIQQKTQGPVQIAGFADSDKVSSLSFPDNTALSLARAKTVAGIIGPRLTDQTRIATQGFGETQPIASNDTPDGKAQNRRVEVIVQRSQ